MDVLLSTPRLWTSPTRSQRISFLHRSGNQPLHIHYLDIEDNVEPFGAFLTTARHNLFRLEGLSITSCSFKFHFELWLRMFSKAAPELKHLELVNFAEMDVELPKIFGEIMPKLTSLEVRSIHTNLRDFNFPSLTRCPLLEFVQVSLQCTPEPSTAPPRRRVCLAALQELGLDQTAGVLDHLVLPKCTDVMLKGQFTGAAPDSQGYHAAPIHPSSIDHIPVTRGITKAVVMPNSCTFSGPNGKVSFWCFQGARNDFDAGFFTSFSPISVSQIRELWVGGKPYFGNTKTSWNQTAAGVRDAFEVLTTVEDLTLLSCQTKPIFTTLQATADGGIIFPRLKRLTIYVGFGDLDISALTRCAKARKKHSRPLGEVTVVWRTEQGIDITQELESLRKFVGELDQRVGKAPKLSWRPDEPGGW